MKVMCIFGRCNYGDVNRGEGYEYSNFLPALRRNFDDLVFFESLDRSAYQSFSDFNRAFLRCVEENRPDVIFCVLMHYELWAETFKLIRQGSPALLIHWGTDDSWKFAESTRFLAPLFHAHATTSKAALLKARALGIENLVATQWAANADCLIAPLPALECKYQISFVGSAYGKRPQWIAALRNRGIDVACFGHGWPSGAVAAEDIPRIVRSSVISLNFADAGSVWPGASSHSKKQLKARVFEAPGAGGFLLTEKADGIEDYFEPGHEIAVFSNADDLAEKIQYFLSHPEARRRIANAGFERARAEHTYDQRFSVLLREATALAAASDPGRKHRSWNIDWKAFDDIADTHRIPLWGRWLRAVLITPLAMVWGKRRGARAARRLVFELSWRIAGAHTYSAKGLPGRLFFHES